MSSLSQEELGGNPPEPGSGANGGRKSGLSPELIEHRLTELEQTAKENRKDLADIKTIVTKIESGMITKSQLVIALISVLVITAINLIVWMANWMANSQ